MIKLIFLDIDGVLNHELYYVEKHQQQRANEVGYPLSDIDPEKVKLLNELVEKTGAEVVISSSWRKGRTVEELSNLLKQAGFIGSVIGKTPSLYYDNDASKSTVPRGCEIEEFLYRTHGYDHFKRVNYVIFDDDSDMLLSQRENYFRVDGYCGLTNNIIWRASHKLNKFDAQKE